MFHCVNRMPDNKGTPPLCLYQGNNVEEGCRKRQKVEPQNETLESGTKTKNNEAKHPQKHCEEICGLLYSSGSQLKYMRGNNWIVSIEKDAIHQTVSNRPVLTPTWKWMRVRYKHLSTCADEVVRPRFGMRLCAAAGMCFTVLNEKQSGCDFHVIAL